MTSRSHEIAAVGSERLERARVWLAVTAAGSVLVQQGFRLGAGLNFYFNILDVLLLCLFVAELGVALWQSPRKKQVVRVRVLDLLALALLLVGLGVIWSSPGWAESLNSSLLHFPSLSGLELGLVKTYLLAAVFIQVLRGIEGMLHRNYRPEVLLAGSLAALILLGTTLLLLPRATPLADPPLRFVDALFTATSAASVTGLTVADTGKDFSGFGQVVILGLIQVGGLGIIMFVAFLSVTSSRVLPVSQMVVFQQVVSAPTMGGLKARVVGIILFTFAVEMTGAVLLFGFASQARPGEDPGWLAYWSVFHAISAFCNAGFGLETDNLVQFASSPGINLTVMGLIVLGGIGFLVIPEVAGVIIRRMSLAVRKRHLWSRSRLRQWKLHRLSIQTRLTLVVTVLLIVFGTIGFWVMERNHLLVDYSWDQAALASLFQSVSPRTAGFNTVPIGDLRGSTLLLIIILMVIGASPVSAGGGIKTVTLAILLLALRSMILSRDRVEVYGRTVPFKTLIAALSVFVLYTGLAAVTTFLLAIFEPGFYLRDHLFESISALSTVGLSTGITPQLTTASKVTLCVAMFIGRIGPISMALSVFRARPRVEYDLPTEDVVVG